MSAENAIILENLLNNLVNQEHADHIKKVLKIIGKKGDSRFALALIETILVDTDQDRIEMMIKSGHLLHPKEGLAMNINMKPLVKDLLSNKNLIMANIMVHCLKLCHSSQDRKYQHFMYLAPHMFMEEVEGYQLHHFFDFFVEGDNDSIEDIYN